MLGIDIQTWDEGQIKAVLQEDQKHLSRVIEQALDATAFDVREGLQDEMKRVFNNPTRFTLNSLKVNKTENHNMEANVWLKKPERMTDHYLLPQIIGGVRKTKGFERALGDTRLFPAKGLKLNKHGNMTRGMREQILSALGYAERHQGYQANRTKKSAKRNRKRQRRYVYLFKSSGKIPGIYQRVGKGERNLKAVLFEGHQDKSVKPLLKFYIVSELIANERFAHHFNRLLGEVQG
jgi:hypothetical protein